MDAEVDLLALSSSQPSPSQPQTSIITEILRTQHCFPDTRLLVDKISVTAPNSRGREAYILTLSDGTTSITALVKRDMHVFFTTGVISEGSYVKLREFEIRSVRNFKAKTNETVLVIGDVEADGNDGREDGVVDLLREGGDGEDKENEISTSTKRKREHDREVRSSQGSHQGSQPLQSISPNKRTCPSPRAEKESESTSSVLLPVLPAAHLTITPLSDLKPSPTMRSMTFTVLILIVSVSSTLTIRPKLPPSRELQVMDGSTSRKVHLSVFVNAETFEPSVGSIALMQGLRGHEWKGGSLKAYSNRCKEGEWCVLEPRGYENEAQGLKRLWDEVKPQEP